MSDSDRELEVYRQFQAAQNKYDYFLMAVAASAIALCLKRTEGMSIRGEMILLALAVLSWGGSFFVGCRRQWFLSSSLFSNMEMLSIQRGAHPEIGTHPQVIKAASDGIKSALERNSGTAARLAKSQFWLLILGAVFYTAWHVTDMILRSVT